MGVPAFYRWLISRYPKIVLNNIENLPLLSQDDPEHVYDNLYIDMNGLIHPCAHPEDRPPPKDEQEIYENIGKYVDRLFTAIKPTRLLFLSIDGVAPRAKMNQQRARRYRAAQDRKERDELTKQVLSELFPEISLPADQVIWDSNVITPGTVFMANLSDYLHEYIEDKMKNDEEWKNIKVIFSDSSVCGEGEHKIMSFIRSQRAQEGYDPNQHHVVHGLDADLIMLALGTHEPKFSILREEQLSPYEKKKEKRRQSRTATNPSAAAADNDDGDEGSPSATTAPSEDWVRAQKLLCLRVAYLREYLASEFEFLREIVGERYDLERIIDDIIFLCYFAGNDFLPHLPTIEIREGGIDLLLNAYKELLPHWNDYITGTNENGERLIHTMQLSDLLRKVSQNESDLLVAKEAEEQKLDDIAASSDTTARGIVRRPSSQNTKQTQRVQRLLEDSSTLSDDGLAELMKVVKEEVDRRIANAEKDAADAQRRQLRGQIHGANPKERYYNNPFHTKDLVDGKGLDLMCTSYLNGLCWVLNYYLQGPPSWAWYYPFHYSPCASDLFAKVDELSTSTPTLTYPQDHSSPLKPVEQLLCVLPAESASALPAACRGLMTSKSSPLSEYFHPQEIVIDRGNQMSWLWILLLPFIDVNRIIKASRECEPHFTSLETLRNQSGTSFLYVNAKQCSNISNQIADSSETSTPKDDLRDCLSPAAGEENNAIVYPLYGFVSHTPVEDSSSDDENEENDENDQKEEYEEERILCFQYFLPTETIHRSALIEGIRPFSSPLDLKFNRKKWNKSRRGRSGGGGGRGRGRGGGNRGDGGGRRGRRGRGGERETTELHHENQGHEEGHKGRRSEQDNQHHGFKGHASESEHHFHHEHHHPHHNI